VAGGDGLPLRQERIAQYDANVDGFLRRYRTWRLNGRFRWLAFVLLYAVLANLPFWIASRNFGLLFDGCFCLEFVAIGLLALFLPSFSASPLLLLAIAADLISAVCRTYLLSVRECLTNFGFVHSLSSSRLLSAAAIVAVTLLVCVLAALLPAAAIGQNRRRATACLFGFAVLCTAIDCIAFVRNTGSFPNPMQFMQTRVLDAVKPGYFSDLRACRVPLLRLARTQRSYFNMIAVETAKHSPPLPIPNASELAIRTAGIAPGASAQKLPNLVIVLAESWGAPADPAIATALVQPYLQPGLEARYQVVQGTVPFYGGTVTGEARELCGTTIGYNLLNASPRELEGCLPHRLAALGYRGIALHGMDAHLFSRWKWYSAMGFQEQWFHRQFQQQELPDCLGAFIGTCDAAIADWIARRLASERGGPEFVHWVTLNSHLPVPAPSPFASSFPCSFAPLLARHEAACAWYQLVANVHRSVAALAMGNLIRPTVFVVVGDHAPPFADPQLRNQFSSTDVPYVLLLPRQNSPAAGLDREVRLPRSR
jgi:hypothetical protein